MILDGIIAFVVDFVAPFLNSFLPHLSLGTVPSVVQSAADTLGSAVAFLGPIVPVDVVLAWLAVLSVLLPAVAAYFVFNWVWRHIPTIAGFGTGSG